MIDKNKRMKTSTKLWIGKLILLIFYIIYSNWTYIIDHDIHIFGGLGLLFVYFIVSGVYFGLHWNAGYSGHRTKGSECIHYSDMENIFQIELADIKKYISTGDLYPVKMWSIFNIIIIGIKKYNLWINNKFNN